SAYRKARLLLSIHLLPPSEYANAERSLEAFVPANAVDEAIEQAAGDLIRKNLLSPLRPVHFSCSKCGMISTFSEEILQRRLRERSGNSENGAPLPCCVSCGGEVLPVFEKVAAAIAKLEVEESVD